MTEKRSEKRPGKQKAPGARGAAEVIPLPRRGGGRSGGQPAARCPICGKPESPEHRPFCSTRCSDIDLGRWLKGIYRVPTEEAPSEDEPAEPGRDNEEPE